MDAAALDSDCADFETEVTSTLASCSSDMRDSSVSGSLLSVRRCAPAGEPPVSKASASTKKPIRRDKTFT